MDPMSGRRGLAELRQAPGSGPEVRLQLQGRETVILRTFRASGVEAKPWPYRTVTGPPIPLRGRWRVEFVAGGPRLPQGYATGQLASWTERGGEAERFAGTARYTLAFDDPAGARAYLLELGRVAESARVLLNGQELGTLIGRPFQVATGRLQPRGNRLVIEVTNVAANRIRDLDRRGVPWKIFHDINFVNINYEPFDASGWPVRESGLLGPLRLLPLR